jgi:ribosomal-protein-alanine N-acetyltransferase
MAVTIKQLNELLPALIQGTRLRLAPFADKHLNKTYVSWLNNTNVVRYSNQRFVQHSTESCRRYFDSFEGTSNRFYAIEDCSSGKLIGTLTMYINLHHETADVGILIGAVEHWGKGYGYEAFGLAIDALLTSAKLRKVTAGAMACNAGMIKVMTKCGMHLEATRKDQELLNGELVDILYFAKFSSQ